ncbi:MAG: MarR family transcriptional regulator [Ktedonobacterales bacterium]
MKTQLEDAKLRRNTRLNIVPWLRLARIYQRIDRATEMLLRNWDLSVAQFDALAQIRASEGLTQQQLADRLLVTKGNISQLLERLEARSLIERRADGRARRLYLTRAGRTLAQEVVPAQEGMIAARFSILSEDERAELAHLLRTLDHALNHSQNEQKGR